MNCSLDKNSEGPVFSLLDFIFNGGACEQKRDMKMPTKMESFKRNHSLFPSTATNSTASFISSLCSNLHCQTMLNPIIPQKRFLKDIPSFNTRKDLMSLFNKHFTVMGQLSDACMIDTKLKDILMPFIPNHSLASVGSDKWQCLIPDVEEIKTSHEESLHSEEDCQNQKEPLCGDLLKPVGDSPEVMEVDEEDDIIFDHDISMDLSSCDDNDIDEEEDDDNDDEDSDDNDDIDFSDWNEVDDKYSPCKTPPESNESSSSFTLDNLMLKWDPGIEEELKNLPRTSKASYKSWLDSSDDDDNDNAVLFEANRKWNTFYCSHSKRKGKNRIIAKKVSFAVDNKLLMIHQWDDCEGNRSGPWHQYALDRARFKRRIEECEGKLSKVLQPQHRIKMSLLITNCK